MGTLILAVGGTGGHIYPAVALGKHLRKKIPGTIICVAGKRGGQEERIAKTYGFEFEPVEVAKAPKKKLSPAILKFALDLPVSVLSGISAIKKIKPSAVVGFGGYVSFPTVIGAAVKGIPAYIHEQNAFAGKANRFLAKFAKGVFISYENTSASFPGKAIFTGNPSRFEGMGRLPKEEAEKKLGLAPGRFTILVFGGSQGAKKINDAVFEFCKINLERNDMQILHLTGKANYESAKEFYKKTLKESGGMTAVAMDYLEDMRVAFSAAGLAICRSGASTLSEISSLGVPAILVPYPFATDNHQFVNAGELVKSGASLLIEDRELDGERLSREVADLMGTAGKLAGMAEKTKGMYKSGAAGLMTDVLAEYLNS